MVSWCTAGVPAPARLRWPLPRTNVAHSARPDSAATPCMMAQRVQGKDHPRQLQRHAVNSPVLHKHSEAGLGRIPSSSCTSQSHWASAVKSLKSDKQLVGASNTKDCSVAEPRVVAVGAVALSRPQACAVLLELPQLLNVIPQALLGLLARTRSRPQCHQL